MGTTLESNLLSTYTNGVRQFKVPTEKTEGQIAAEQVREIDSLHEPALASQTQVPYFDPKETICAECWTLWPCSTHRVIHGDE